MRGNRKISLISASSLLAFAMLANACGVWNNPQYASDEIPELTVFGQPNLNNVLTHGSTPSATTLANPLYQLKVGARWFVSDYLNNRVLIYNGASAVPSAVLGPADFVTSAGNGGRTATANSLNTPTQIASDGTRLAIADSGNNRILIWNTLPTRTNQPADVVVGQNDFTSATGNQGLAAPTAATLSYPMGVAFVGAKFIISDDENHRVLVYNSVPTSHGAAASVVIGQNDFVTNTANRGGAVSAQSLQFPFCLGTDGTRLAVADWYNHRVLIWNTVPTAPNVDADVVIGQAGFGTNANATTQSGLYYPTHGLFVGAALYVADSNNHRVPYWATVPASGAAGGASGVVGQANFTSGSSNRGGSLGAAGFNLPRALAFDGSVLRVADTGNNRVLEFSSLPTGSGDTATAVYGQPSLTEGASPNQMGVSRQGVNEVAALCVSRKYLIVGDRRNHRFLVFDKLAKASGSGAIAVIGQADFSANLANQGLAGPTASTISLNTWGGCAVDDQDRLYISDINNHRILIFNQVPTVNNASADFVMGQDTFTTNTMNQGANGLGWLRQPRGIVAQGNQLFVGDYNARALIYNLPITTNHPLATAIVTQPNTTTVTAGTTQLKVGVVFGVHAEGNRLFVNDGGSNRLLVYNSIPTTTGTLADHVIGRPDFTTTGTALTATGLGTQFYSPAMGVVDGFLFVPDRSNHRIVGYNLNQLANGMPATRIIGQADYTSAKFVLLNAAGTSFENFNLPTYFLTDPDGQFIWIGEMGNHRVLRIKRSAFWNYVR